MPMRPIIMTLLRAATGIVLATAAAAALAATEGDAKRGAYVAIAGGCVACHTADAEDAVRFAGGRALKTPFGTFYGPNITPHPQAGIGRWSEANFVRALREGRRPDGAHYYPAFPYTTYTRIANADLRDLWAYLRSLPPDARKNQAHDLKFPFNFRFLMWLWKWLFFNIGPVFADGPAATPVARGEYLVNALSHCGECHTPRNFLGASISSRFLGGGKEAPNLTPTKLKKWSDGELREFLKTGNTADGDVPAEDMGEVITNTTSRLAPGDLAAIIAYLRSLPPLPADAK